MLVGLTSGSEDLDDVLRRSELFRFADWPCGNVPRATAGVYTIWDLASGAFIYVGIAGAAAPKAGASFGLANRLAKHASGARSGDRFCIYVQDRFVLPALSKAEIDQVAAGALSLDRKVRDHIRTTYGFRFAPTVSVIEARLIEARLKRGGWPAGPPLLNPAKA